MREHPIAFDDDAGMLTHVLGSGQIRQRLACDIDGTGQDALAPRRVR